jgi:protein-disulfide isomerase
VQDAVGDEAFFEFASAAFERQSEYSMSMIAETAASVGADPCAVQNDAANEVYRPVLEADRSLGQEVGVDGTPETIVDGQFVDSNVEAISAAIDSKL